MSIDTAEGVARILQVINDVQRGHSLAFVVLNIYGCVANDLQWRDLTRILISMTYILQKEIKSLVL